MDIGQVIKYNVVIQPTSNYGFVVDVGCGKFAFESKKSLIEAFSDFLDHPQDAENEYNKIARVPQPAIPEAEPDAPVEQPVSERG